MQLDINFLVHTETVRIRTFCYRKFQIRCILRRNTAAILRIFSLMRFLIASHIPSLRSRAEIGFDQISLSTLST